MGVKRPIEFRFDPAIDDMGKGIYGSLIWLNGLGKVTANLEKQFEDAFHTGQQGANGYQKSLSSLVRTLKKDLQDLEGAFEQAADPIGRVLIPVLSQAVQKVTGIVQGVGLVLNALMGTDVATKKVEKAVAAEKALKKASVSAASAVKRSLAGFDQINRLNGPTGRSGGTSSGDDKSSINILPGTVADTLTPQVQAIANKIRELIEPVLAIDFIPMKRSLQELGSAVAELGGIILQSLQWAWFEILVPLGTWLIEAAAPASVNVLTAAFKALSAALVPVLQGIGELKPYLEPVVSFIGETVIITLKALQQQFELLAQAFGLKGEEIRGVFDSVGQSVAYLWERMAPILQLMRAGWFDLIGALIVCISDCVGGAITLLGGLVTFISGALAGNWQQAWNGLGAIFRGFVNGVIGAVNGMIQGVVSGINAVIRALNQIRFTLPTWSILGNLAGRQFALNVGYVSAPKVPYLAKGAVLPANRPFLAMVGDQHHGTNVEAPLTTIQEAVALVMEDMAASNTAGQEMIVALLRELLEAVMGIRIGDEVIGRAVQRYNRKMAVMKGGMV